MFKAEMTSRERVLAAAHRQAPDRVPRDIPLEKFMVNRMVEYYGTQDLLTAMRSDIAIVNPGSTRLNQDYSGYYSSPGVTWDEWGRGRIWDQNNQYAEYLFPLEHAVTMDEFIHYPWPDLDAGLPLCRHGRTDRRQTASRLCGFLYPDRNHFRNCLAATWYDPTV